MTFTTTANNETAEDSRKETSPAKTPTASTEVEEEDQQVFYQQQTDLEAANMDTPFVQSITQEKKSKETATAAAAVMSAVVSVSDLMAAKRKELKGGERYAGLASAKSPTESHISGSFESYGSDSGSTTTSSPTADSQDQQHDPQQQKSSQDARPVKTGDVGTFLNMVKANIGSGILGMPYAFRHGGVVLGGITVFILMLVAVYAVRVLVISKERAKKATGKSIRSYAEVAKFAFNRPGQWAVEGILLFCQFGFCVSYLIFIGENLHHLLPVMPKWFWILVTMASAAPFCIIRNVKYLTPAAFSSLAVFIISVGIILYFDFISLDPVVISNIHFFNFAQFPMFIGIAIFSFEGVGMALPLHENMKNGDTTRFSIIFLLALLVITTALALFGILGYMAFGEDVRDVITLNLPNVGLVSIGVTVGLMVSVFFTYPFAMYPLAEVFDTYLRHIKFGNERRSQFFHRRIRFHLENVIRLVVIFLSAAIAIVGQDAFGLALSLVGGVGGSCLAFIFPVSIYLRTCYKELQWYTVLGCSGIILFGLVTSILTTVLAAKDIWDSAM